jgi:hypothetical protein
LTNNNSSGYSVAIQYIKHTAIDYPKWDNCITQSLNGEVYAFSWFLDAITDHWDALIEDDYKAIMPLVYRQRFAYKEIYIHPLIRHLGIFSRTPVNATKIDQFLKALPSRFRKIQICFNRQNTQAIKTPGTNLRPVFELDLIIPYEKKLKTYPESLVRNLSNAVLKKISIVKQITLSDFEFFLRSNIKPGFVNNIIKPLRIILSRLLISNKAEIIGVYGSINSLLATACFVSSNQNVALLFAYSSSEAVSSSANYLLLDTFLKSYSGRNVTLSLEHLDDTWTEQFYLEFGALKSKQYCLTLTRLPFLFRRFA